MFVKQKNPFILQQTDKTNSVTPERLELPNAVSNYTLLSVTLER